MPTGTKKKGSKKAKGKDKGKHKEPVLLIDKNKNVTLVR